MIDEGKKERKKKKWSGIRNLLVVQGQSKRAQKRKGPAEVTSLAKGK